MQGTASLCETRLWGSVSSKLADRGLPGKLLYPTRYRNHDVLALTQHTVGTVSAVQRRFPLPGRREARAPARGVDSPCAVRAVLLVTQHIRMLHILPLGPLRA